jgi:hypothetical protein
MQKKTLKTPPELPNDLDKNAEQQIPAETPSPKPVEIGGPKGLEPTRYGDWETAGRCSDF